MRATGIVRKIDQLGRMVIPKELRKSMDINTKDPIEIFVDEDQIILRKFSPGCIFCDEREETVEFKGKIICKECLNKMQE